VTPGSQAIAEEEAAALEAAMSRLPDDYREVIQLRNWQALAFKEIGERMGRSADATRKLWYRAILQLQQEMESDERSSDP
jgi:RNA polymerase sigma factor (sigma-70 family)